MRGNVEGEESQNRGIYRDLLEYTASYDPVLRMHLEASTVFSGASATIQNDLLDCCFTVYQEAIKKEIKDSPYAALLGDETTRGPSWSS